jgi:hypothetical protein
MSFCGFVTGLNTGVAGAVGKDRAPDVCVLVSIPGQARVSYVREGDSL